MRWLVCFAVAIAGCVASLPADDTSITADLACETARALVEMRRGPAPSPRPDGDRCENCGGRGTVGDGRVSVTCPVCDGTGKRKAALCVTGTCGVPR